MAKPKIVFSQKCLEYGQHRQPENPERLKYVDIFFKILNYEIIEPELAEENDLKKAHSSDYIEKLRQGKISDIDTPALKDIFLYAKMAAGAAIKASEIKGFSLMRPPGHHAGKNGKALGAASRGFCYLNNIAIAVKKLDKPTLIIDIDGHHGNGTEEIFYGSNTVSYLSLHRSPYYPGTGYFSRNNCHNYPVEAECGEEIYLKVLDKAIKNVNHKNYEYLAISAGFDTYAGDLASLNLTEKTYEEISKRLASLNKPTFFVLEGGYLRENLGKNIVALLSCFQ